MIRLLRIQRLRHRRCTPLKQRTITSHTWKNNKTMDIRQLAWCCPAMSFLWIMRLFYMTSHTQRLSYYVYRYQGKMNGHKDAVVLLSYPEKSFREAKALRVFISTHTELTAQEILNIYAKRWNIEVFFRNCKQKLAFDKCQLRKKQGVTRMWLILSLIHFLCCTVSGCFGSFDEGYNYFRNCVLQEIFAQNAFSA